MTCSYCRSLNSEADHRCRRCGRRLTGSAVAAPAEYAERAVRALGANALAAATAATAEMDRPEPTPRIARNAHPEAAPSQPSLFLEENGPRVVPFVTRRAVETQETAAAPALPRPKSAPRRKIATDPLGDQTTLDFLPTMSPQKSRMLKTTVEAVIYCDAKPASPMHRATAAMLDAAMIFLGFGIFLIIFQLFGSGFTWNKQTIAVFLGAFGLIAMFYGFVWMLGGRETVGMSWTDLRIVTFNGFPPDRKIRALRMVGCWLSFCSGMIGILWALVDEESLTWHDHMSKTFPTLRETDSTIVRQ